MGNKIGLINESKEHSSNGGVTPSGLISLQNVHIHVSDQFEDQVRAAKLRRMTIANQTRITNAIKSSDIHALQQIFQIQGISLFQNVQQVDANAVTQEYQNSMHLAFLSMQENVIDYFLALSSAQNSLVALMNTQDSNGQDIYDICVSNSDRLVKSLIRFGCVSYSHRFITHCLTRFISLCSQVNDAYQKQLFEKYRIKQQEESSVFYIPNEILYTTTFDIPKQFKLFRVSEILDIVIQDILLFPIEFKTHALQQSTRVHNCYLISIIKSLIHSTHVHLIKDLLRKSTITRHEDKQDYSLTFNGAYEVRLLNRVGKQKWVSVDDRFYFDKRNKECLGSEINMYSIYFNLIEKVWMQLPLKNRTGVSVHSAMIALLDVPVVDIQLQTFADRIEQLILLVEEYIQSKYLVIASVTKENQLHSVSLISVDRINMEVEYEDTTNNNQNNDTASQQSTTKLDAKSFLTVSERLTIGIIRDRYCSHHKNSLVLSIKETQPVTVKITSPVSQDMNLRLIAEQSSNVAQMSFCFYENENDVIDTVPTIVNDSTNYFMASTKPFLHCVESVVYSLRISCEQMRSAVDHTCKEGIFYLVPYSEHPLQLKLFVVVSED